MKSGLAPPQDYQCRATQNGWPQGRRANRHSDRVAEQSLPSWDQTVHSRSQGENQGVTLLSLNHHPVWLHLGITVRSSKPQQRAATHSCLKGPGASWQLSRSWAWNSPKNEHLLKTCEVLVCPLEFVFGQTTIIIHLIILYVWHHSFVVLLFCKCSQTNHHITFLASLR